MVREQTGIAILKTVSGFANHAVAFSAVLGRKCAGDGALNRGGQSASARVKWKRLLGIVINSLSRTVLKDRAIQFEWTKARAEAASRAALKAAVGRSWLLLGGGVMILALGGLDYQQSGASHSLVAALMGLMMIVVFIFRGLARRRWLRDFLRAWGESEVRLTLGEESLQIEQGDDRAVLRWEQLTRIRRVDEFLMLYSRSILCAMIPEDVFEPDQLRYLTAAVGGRGVGN